MATSDGISTKDWDIVHELSLNLFNTVDTEEELNSRKRLMDYLDNLEVEYGQLPGILATRADFIVDVERKKYLLLHAYALAETRGDQCNQLEIAHSLSEIYIEDFRDAKEGTKWLDCFSKHVVQRGNLSDDKEEYELLLKTLEKLKVQSGLYNGPEN